MVFHFFRRFDVNLRGCCYREYSIIILDGLLKFCTGDIDFFSRSHAGTGSVEWSYSANDYEKVFLNRRKRENDIDDMAYMPYNNIIKYEYEGEF